MADYNYNIGLVETGVSVLCGMECMVFKKVIRESSCSGVSLFAALISSICFGERETVSVLFSRKNCDNEMPKAWHIFSREGIEGIIFLRYQEEIVDCAIPDSTAS